jgi:hypothetical protein
LNSAGYIIIFWQIQQDIKKEMLYKISQVIPSDKLTCIKFLKKDVSPSDWNEKNEFEFQGEMYDVVKKIETSSYYMFYCLNDEKEEMLIKTYNSNFDYNKEKNTPNNTRNFFSSIAPAILNKNIVIKRTDTWFSINYLSFHYQSVLLETITPPPKAIV